MRRGTVLLLTPILAGIAERLAASHEVIRLWEADDRDAVLDAVAQRVEVLGTDAFVGADAALIDRFPRLELVASFGVGLDRIDVAYATSRDVRVTHTPGVLDDDVADLAFALLLATCRQVARGDRFVRAGEWPDADFPLGRRLSGRRLGILGLGRIGKAVARRAAGFAMQVHYHGRREQADQPYTYHADPVSLAAAVDFLVVLLPGGAATQALVGREVLAALGPEGTLVNVARGAVVDEPVLVEMLGSGALGAAGLDVFANEPQVPERLLALDNVVLLPHQGSATSETRAAMAELVLANMEAHYRGAALPSAAN